MHALLEKVKAFFTTEEHEIATKYDATLAMLTNLARRVEALEQKAVAEVKAVATEVEAKV